MRVSGKAVVVVSLLLTAAAAWAQAPGGGGGPGGDRRARSPKFQLMDSVISAGELTKSTKCPLKADQAKKVAALVKGLQKKPKLTDDDAKASLKTLKAALTPRQMTEIGRLTRERRERMMARFRQGGFGGGKGGPGGGMGMGGGKGGPGGGMGMGGGKGGPGGGMGMGGGKGGFGRPSAADRARFREYNFFAPPKADNPMGQRFYQPVKDTITALEKTASGKK